MIDSFFAALETTGPAAMLRSSLLVYPAVNGGHIIGIALLVGGIIPLDLRMLGVWQHVPLLPLLRVLTTTAAVGLVLAVFFGALLFSTRATAYIASDIFITKMALVAAGTFNALIMRLMITPSAPPPWINDKRLPSAVRLAALLSLLIWLSVLFLGRLIAYV